MPQFDFPASESSTLNQPSGLSLFNLYGDIGPVDNPAGLDLGKIFLPEPVNREHPFAEHLLAKWQVLRGWQGGRKLNDLLGRYRVTFATASTVYPSWKSTIRPGGYGELSFDGSNTYIDCGQILGFTAEPFSIHAWIKTTSNTATFKAIAGRGYLASAIGYGLYVDASGFPIFQVRNGGTISAPTGATAINDGIWHFLHGVRSGGVSKLYVDGKLAASDSTAVTIGSDSSKFEIGARDSGGPNFVFPGSIDDVAVYQRSFNTAEAFNLYNELRDGSQGLLRRANHKTLFIASNTARTYNETGSGGAIASGSASPQVNYNPSASGGAVCGGYVNAVFSDIASGGAVCNGSASVDQVFAPPLPCGCNTYSFVASGGATCGGSISEPTGGTPQISGGVVVSRCSAYVTVGNRLWDEFEAFWLLQEDGGPYADLTGHGNTGLGGDGSGDTSTIPTLDDGSKCTDSQLFSGRQMIRLPDGTLGVWSPITVSAWINLDSDFVARTIYSRGSEDTWSFKFGYSFLRQLTASVQLVISGVTTEYKVIGATQLEKDRWYFVSVVYDPGNKLAVYVDAVKDKSTSLPYAPLVVSSGGNEIGAFGLGSWFQGNAEEMSVENVARSAAELAATRGARCDSAFFSVGPVETPAG